jgi:uncharacterized protein YlxW (UPF0749 family)
MTPEDIIKNPLIITALAFLVVYGVAKLFMRRESVEISRDENKVKEDRAGTSREEVYIKLVNDNILRLARQEVLNESLEKKVDNLTLKVENLESKNALMEEKSKMAAKELEVSKRAVADRDQEIVVLRTRVDSLEKRNAYLESEIKELQAKVVKYETRSDGTQG